MGLIAVTNFFGVLKAAELAAHGFLPDKGEGEGSHRPATTRENHYRTPWIDSEILARIFHAPMEMPTLRRVGARGLQAETVAVERGSPAGLPWAWPGCQMEKNHQIGNTHLNRYSIGY